ncbi:cupredoxin domain-containing protein [Candidatus Korobacter versatilis]|nr:cupredoxin family copper-binding protein [Candidatus Koribacter versatilis]
MRVLMVLAVLLASAVAFAQTPVAAQPATAVAIDNFMFSPMTIEVERGTTITWVNKDDIPHVVASTTGKFKSRAIDTDGTFAFTFTEPGTYEYYCSIHPKMVGKIVVK